MPAIELRHGHSRTLLEELEPDSEDCERDVQFSVPTSRRQSGEDQISRPRAFAISEDVSTSFLLIHTFQLSSQCGTPQIAFLPPTPNTGARCLAASRDDVVHCLHYSIRSSPHSSEEVVILPRNSLLNSLPIEKPWRIAALACLPHDADIPDSADVVACLGYLPRSKETMAPESENVARVVLMLAWIDPVDTIMDFPTLRHAAVPSIPHGCNQLIWWKPEPCLYQKGEMTLLIPSQDGPVYAVKLMRSATETNSIAICSPAECCPDLEKCELNSINSIDFFDDVFSSKRLVACSSGSRSDIHCGVYNWRTCEWMDIWRVQHDSMTCKLRFFAGDTSGVIANLLVLGLGELAVVYLDILSNNKAVSTVLPHSNRHDVTTCCEIMDIDNDGEPELLLGTYGRVVLMYKLVAGGAILFRIIETAFPVCFVCVADMTQQGKRGELVVVTQKAVQIYCLGRN